MQKRRINLRLFDRGKQGRVAIKASLTAVNARSAELKKSCLSSVQTLSCND